METKPDLKIGFICGREDQDIVPAPEIPKEHWVNEKQPTYVHTDVALWWYVKQHYPNVKADMIDPSKEGELTEERLRSNDINLLLGWDAVSAHIDEFSWKSEEPEKAFMSKPGFAAKVTEWLANPKNKCWPPKAVQDLVNAKDYIGVAKEAGLNVPPTIRHIPQRGGTKEASDLIDQAKARGWKRLCLKPVPSSWGLGIEFFDLSAAESKATLKKVEKYLATTATSKVILAQEEICGMADFPETRCYWIGDDFQYSVANLKHKMTDGKNVEIVTSQPDMSTLSETQGPLPKKYWQPAKAIGEDVMKKVLPKLKTFGGKELKTWPWYLRVDVGRHKAGLHDHEMKEQWKGKTMQFLNEVEIAPTLYAHKRLKHSTPLVPLYGPKLVNICATVCDKDPNGPWKLFKEPEGQASWSPGAKKTRTTATKKKLAGTPTAPKPKIQKTTTKPPQPAPKKTLKPSTPEDAEAAMDLDAPRTPQKGSDPGSPVSKSSKKAVVMSPTGFDSPPNAKRPKKVPGGEQVVPQTEKKPEKQSPTKYSPVKNKISEMLKEDPPPNSPPSKA